MDNRCQQFTPDNISKNMLDIAEYKDNLFGKKILENSCGQGHILKYIIERYIIDCKKRGYTNNKIKYGLENDIYGAEIKEDTYKICIENLNNVAKNYGITNIKWKIFNNDILKEHINIEFDYIIGNPPYISYRNLDEKERIFIKENFETCKNGKPDYCYAFIENAISYLKNNGQMVYLIPNSIFKNVFAKKLREIMLEHLIKIFDYHNQKLFENALTSSAIILLRKNSNSPIFNYISITNNKKYCINKSILNEKWIFEKNIDCTKDEEIYFEQYFKAGITIATQKNNVFVIDLDKKNELNLENDLIKTAISPRNRKYSKKEYIIFPYKLKKNCMYKLNEEEFKIKYPNIYNYLLRNKKELDNRRADKSAQWFEYGRSQAIKNMYNKKLLISTIVTNEVNVYELEKDDIPYSGIYIIAEKNNDLNIAKSILKSKEFFDYVLKIGTPASGKSVRITARDVNRFKISKKEYNLL